VPGWEARCVIARNRSRVAESAETTASAWAKSGCDFSSALNDASRRSTRFR
jgi:hypothetical protein